MSIDRYYAGLGCRRGCAALELEELLSDSLRAHALDIGQIAALATIDTKRDEPGLHELAQRLKVPLLFFEAEQLAAFERRLLTPSTAALRETGIAGIAESCALAAAELSGANGDLLGARRKSAAATCAIARAESSSDERSLS